MHYYYYIVTLYKINECDASLVIFYTITRYLIHICLTKTLIILYSLVLTYFLSQKLQILCSWMSILYLVVTSIYTGLKLHVYFVILWPLMEVILIFLPIVWSINPMLDLHSMCLCMAWTILGILLILCLKHIILGVSL